MFPVPLGLDLQDREIAWHLCECVFVLSKHAGNAECVKLVIANGASLEAYDLYNGTPLHVACVNQHLECVKVLLNAGRNKKLGPKSWPSSYTLQAPYKEFVCFVLSFNTNLVDCVVGFWVHWIFPIVVLYVIITWSIEHYVVNRAWSLAIGAV